MKKVLVLASQVVGGHVSLQRWHKLGGRALLGEKLLLLVGNQQCRHILGVEAGRHLDNRQKVYSKV